MKKKISFCLLALGLAYSARATVFSYNVDNINGTIPDNDLNGYQSSQNISGLLGNTLDVNVTLNISGGFNGDFYAWVSHNNIKAVLLNRVGRTSSSSVGYPDAGFGLDAALNRFTFDDQAGHDVHLYRTFSYTLNGSGQLTGQWQPDGRNLDPLSAGALFDSAPRTNTLSGFNGTDPNGLWTLYVADVSSGSEGTLMSWGLAINVPEPGSAALLCSGLCAWACWASRRRRV